MSDLWRKTPSPDMNYYAPDYHAGRGLRNVSKTDAKVLRLNWKPGMVDRHYNAQP
jgi:hypothetical protein